MTGTVAFGFDFMEFIPDASLVEAVDYTVSVSGTATDLVGNTASLSASGSFTPRSQAPVGT